MPRDSQVPQTLTPYLEALRTQLAMALVSRDENARKVPVYCHRIISVLLARMQVLPSLQQQALVELSGVIEELCAELGGIEGGLILVPQLMSHIRKQPDYAAAETCLQTAVRLLSHKPSERGDRLQKQIAKIMGDLQAALHKAIVDQDMKTFSDTAVVSVLNPGQTLALRDYLRRNFPQDAALEIGGMKTIIGGGSKHTMVIELQNVKTLPNAVVVRIDMANSIVGSTVADEFNLISAAHEAGLPVPKPYALETNKDVLGGAFIVVSKIEGRNIGDWFEITEPSRAFAVGLAQALAKLHRIPPEQVVGLRGLDMTMRESLVREIAYYEEIWRASGLPSIAMEQGIAWLKRHVNNLPERRAITHRDVGCHNMLAADGKLAALLDWETAAVGNPAFDLMYAQVAVTQMMPWEEYLAEYQKAGGTIPSEREMVFYRLLIAIYGMHFCLLSRLFIDTGYTDVLMVAYASQRIHLFYDRVLHEAVTLALDSDER